ncbi:lipocalin family protein [Sanyastnella coralliicola]|uniref:lipocalin family protein n=1 Tax=Sanyastnella coralliicola TaxID=3069118 RepID=UPI0027BAA263|nr:lipocalin family protein [Longitalea sp. SCSIO 12813]
MKTIVRTITLMSLAAAFALTSCGKYEDGPGISLRSKKARLVGEWQLEELEIEGTDYTADVNRWEWEFKDDEEFRYSLQIEGFDTYAPQGEWSFSNNKEEVELTFDDGDRVDLEIKRLTNSELWFEFTETYDDGSTELWELKLESK